MSRSMPPRREDVMRRLGQRLRALREERGLSQERVGERAGFTGKYVSEIERGKRDPPLTTLRRIVEDGLGGALPDALGNLARSTANEERPDYAPVRLPRNVAALADQLAALPDARRRQVLALVRGVLALVQRGS